MIRLGLVGIGGYGWSLAQAIHKARKQAGCRLVAAADARLEDFPERTAELEGFGVQLFDDAQAMYDAMAGKCDAVYIATGIASHEPLATRAIRAGYHVHIEKPTAATVQEVDSILATLRDADRMSIIGYQAVHGNDIRFLKEHLCAGAIGEVESLVCHAGWPRKRFYYDRNPWAGELQQGRRWVLDGPAMNALNHQINNMLHLASSQPGAFATPSAVRAELYAAGPINAHDTAAIAIDTVEGPRATFLATHCPDGYWGPEMTIHGSEGTAWWRMRSQAVIRPDDGEEIRCDADNVEHGEMVANFMDALRQEDPSIIRCDAADGRQAILALNGAHESSRRIHRIDPQYLRRKNEGTSREQTIIPGAEKIIRAAAERGCLFSELDDAPAWAVSTERFALDGYTEFPQQFVADQDSA
ncbi:MAG: Gfo/Idh/MocA family protein [Planctomycetota bacterium]